MPTPYGYAAVQFGTHWQRLHPALTRLGRTGQPILDLFLCTCRIVERWDGESPITLHPTRTANCAGAQHTRRLLEQIQRGEQP